MRSIMSNLFDYLHELLGRNSHPLDHEDEIWERFGRSVAVLMLDSTGFSRTTEKHGIVHFLTQLMQMREIIQGVCKESDCHLLRFEADNVYAAFDHPDEAIKTALKIHEAIEREQLMLDHREPFQVCIGIGYGKLLWSETLEGYFGEEINLASKLGEDTAEGGETLISENAYRHAHSDLVAGFSKSHLSMAGIEAAYYRHRHQA
jgi:class 3 adenylate cyclase